MPVKDTDSIKMDTRWQICNLDATSCSVERAILSAHLGCCGINSRVIAAIISADLMCSQGGN